MRLMPATALRLGFVWVDRCAQPILSSDEPTEESKFHVGIATDRLAQSTASSYRARYAPHRALFLRAQEMAAS